MAKQTYSTIVGIIDTLLADNISQLISEKDSRDCHHAILSYSRRRDEFQPDGSGQSATSGAIVLDFASNDANNLDINFSGNVTALSGTGLDGWAIVRVHITAGAAITISGIVGTVFDNVNIRLNPGDVTLLMVCNINGTYHWSQLG